LADRTRRPPQLAAGTQLSPSHFCHRHTAFSNGDANPAISATGRQNTCIDNGFGRLKYNQKIPRKYFPASFCPRDEILASFARGNPAMIR